MMLLGKVFSEDQIFRIDHYLGKETVQNLMALRFANTLFEPLWNSAHIDHVQITVAESLGVGTRGGYYDHAGALRDMVQNHLIQLICLTAMEPPSDFEADAVRDEKLKILRALRPIDETNIDAMTVRGQYKSGAVEGMSVPGYVEEIKGDESSTETFVALKCEIDNWRWAGVPFYLRTGKRLPDRVSEIVITFKEVPHSIFGTSAGKIGANRLISRLQPDEGVKLNLMIKEPGPGGMRLVRVPLDMTFAETFEVRQPDAYERLIMDVVRGNLTLFMRRDEVEAAWKWIDPIRAAWETQQIKPSRIRGRNLGSHGLHSPSLSVMAAPGMRMGWGECSRVPRLPIECCVGEGPGSRGGFKVARRHCWARFGQPCGFWRQHAHCDSLLNSLSMIWTGPRCRCFWQMSAGFAQTMSAPTPRW